MSTERRLEETHSRREPENEQAGGIFAVRQLLKRMINWLANFFQFKEEEEKDAGINLDYQRYK